MHFWDKQRKKALDKLLYRSIHLCRSNIDYQIKHPNETRANPENKILIQCHPEAKIRITKEFLKRMKMNTVPKVDRPHRLNRVG